MLLLDTNVVSELRKLKNGKTTSEFVAWSNSVKTTDFYISAITLMELEIWVLRTVRKDKVQGGMLRNWLNEIVLPKFEKKILPIDEQIALRCAQLNVPDPKNDRDALIAATALVHGFTVVTRNTKDFQHTGVPLQNPWL